MECSNSSWSVHADRYCQINCISRHRINCLSCSSHFLFLYSDLGFKGKWRWIYSTLGIMFFARGCAGKAPSRHLLRHSSKFAPIHRASSGLSSIHRASSSVKAGPNRATGSKLASVKLPPIVATLTPQQRRAAYHADKLYHVGKTSLFKAPSHFAYLLGSWVISLSCIAAAMYTYFSGLWKTESSPDLPGSAPRRPGLAFFVPVANVLTMITIGTLGSWILVRSSNLVTAIELIKTAAGIRMRVSVRRPIPILPQRKLVIAPYDLLLPRSAIRPASVPSFAEMPDEGKGSKPLRFGTWAAKKISFKLWSYFNGSRKIFTHEGFLVANVRGQKEGYKVDIEGTFPNGVWNLVEVSTLEEE